MVATKQRKREMDMINAPLAKNMILFTLPVMAVAILQYLFNTADLIVVGQFESQDAVGAVGTTGSLTSLILSLFIGLSTGTGVCVSVALGAKNEKRVSELVHTSLILAVVCGVVVAIVGWFVAPACLVLMNTSPVILDDAVSYLRIYFLGAPFVLVYNFGYSIMRAIGDTKKPLFFILLSGAVNIGLNILLVTVFHLGVAGVAIATVTAFALSAVLVVRTLSGYDNACRFSFRKLRFDTSCALDVARVGIPAGVQSAIFNIANTLLQASVNSFGKAATSGCAAANAPESITYLAMQSFMNTAALFVGQNYGARKYARIRKIAFILIGYAAALGILMSAIALLLHQPILSLYLSGAPAETAYGIEKLFSVMPFYFLVGLMEVLSGVLRGVKLSILPTISSIVCVCGVRLSWIFFVFPLEAFHSVSRLFYCYPLSWGMNVLSLLVILLIVLPRRCPVEKVVQGADFAS